MTSSIVVKQTGDRRHTIAAVVAEYHVEFKIYPTVELVSNDGVNLAWYADSGTGEDYTDSLDHAATLFAGSVKWDGCSNWLLTNIHACGRTELTDLSTLMVQCWDMAARLCPNFDKTLVEPVSDC